MAAEGARLRSLEIMTRVQTLINDYNHIYNKGCEQSTFLTDAAISKKPEIVSILLFHVVDPEQVCPERYSSCAFDDAFPFEISEAIPSTRNNFFNIMCTLLNTLHGRRDRTQRRYADDYLHGFDVGAFSVVSFEGKRTFLMHSVCSNMPFSVRWLIRNRNANIHVKNSEN